MPACRSPPNALPVAFTALRTWLSYVAAAPQAQPTPSWRPCSACPRQRSAGASPRPHRRGLRPTLIARDASRVHRRSGRGEASRSITILELVV